MLGFVMKNRGETSRLQFHCFHFFHLLPAAGASKFDSKRPPGAKLTGLPIAGILQHRVRIHNDGPVSPRGLPLEP